ncbi:efflux RND transporter permease subunit [Paenibacillus sp. HN-1]|uniref:efflux RND transporter permease subunit n=1 Tax=Paenibacillus TaxID=44249 RepID=UPI001CA986D9|nr:MULTISPECIES: efflux RND transporter permease subunit [Paenibacillus]MBY9077547.1 efflux RND transporter permease subunit [Paenibacillus sp. CGMCC 1.18879]MBY9087818.1 efflux RND transporter permease subunit [Paenibacillus sinensis]
MERLTKWAFGNKAAAGLLIVMALVVGVMSYTSLPMEFMPEADNPQVTITTLAPGQNAQSMEENVTKPIEAAVNSVKGKTEMTSSSGDGFQQVNINFDSKTNMKDATQEVQKAIDALQFPQGVMRPFVLQLNTSMIPVSEITLSFKDGINEDTLKKAETVIIPELQKIEGVSNVSLYGKTSPQVSVKIDPARMAAKGISIAQVTGLLQGRSVSATIGEQTIGGQTGNVGVVSQINSVDTLKALPVAAGVKLADIASVQVSADQESVSRSNGKDVLFAIVMKEANANAVDVGNKVEDTVDKINKDVEGATAEVVFSTAGMVVDSVNSMMREVLLGALFATIVILIFLRNFRATLVTIISIPLSLAVTLYLLDISGITLNIITLGGVAVAVGRLVDDSIVVIENIYRRLQKEPFSIEMMISATKEVAGAITASTIATVAVFLPMGLLRGSLQAFLLPFALTVTYSLLTSLVVALTVVPLLSSRLLRNTSMKEHEPSRWFSRFLEWNLNRKWVSLSIGLIVLIGSIAAYVNMPKGALDASDASLISVELKYPNDTPVSEVVAQGKKLEQVLIKQSQAETVLMQSGNSSDAAKWGNVSSVTVVNFTVAMKKNADSEAFVNTVRGLQSSYPGATLAANAQSLIGSSSTNEYIDITGDDLSKITAVADQVMTKVKTIDGVRKISSNMEDTKPVFSFRVDPAQANAQEIAMQLSAVLNPVPLGQMELNGSPTSVVMAPIAQPASQQDLEKLTIMTSEGPKALSSLAKLEVKDEPAMLYHKEGKPYVRITADVDPKKVSEIGASIKKETDAITLPTGVNLYAGGASTDQSGDFKDIGMTALISIGLVYLIMVLTFKTLRAPLAIMFSLPLAAIGAVVGLLISGVTPDFTALFGALMLIGIVVTNAIVLIDRVKHNEAHMTIREALLEAAGTRMRPILMTAIATICAMLPLLFGHSEQGSIVSQSLAIVVVGGLTAATVLTLIVVPAIYELFYFRSSARQRKQALKQAA